MDSSCSMSSSLLLMKCYLQHKRSVPIVSGILSRFSIVFHGSICSFANTTVFVHCSSWYTLIVVSLICLKLIFSEIFWLFVHIYFSQQVILLGPNNPHVNILRFHWSSGLTTTQFCLTVNLNETESNSLQVEHHVIILAFKIQLCWGSVYNSFLLLNNFDLLWTFDSKPNVTILCYLCTSWCLL